MCCQYLEFDVSVARKSFMWTIEFGENVSVLACVLVLAYTQHQYVFTKGSVRCQAILLYFNAYLLENGKFVNLGRSSVFHKDGQNHW